MRLLWITPGFAADENDHNCIPPQQLLAKELLRRGVDLHIVTLEYPFRDEPYRWNGATVYPCNGRNRRWAKLRTLRRAMQFCERWASSPDSGNGNIPSVIHSFWLGWASGLGERLSRRHGIAHCTTLMGQDVLLRNRLFMLGLNSARAAHFVAVSDFQNDVFEKNTGLRAAHVIPWGVDAAEIPAALPISRSIDVLGVGSLVPVKNWEKWLHVVALSLRTAPDLRAELIGDGVGRGKLEALARRLGLERHVRFTGDLPRQEVLAKMRNARVLLHTARYESFGYVLAEAAMNGCRVAGTPVGALPHFGPSARDTPELAALLLDVLRKDIPMQPAVQDTMAQTAEAYLRVYEGL